ncbi:MAG: SnoaL-like domain-containing protein [Nonomuraea sp.]|nr:SnoaL-like domain-containing protein [Nonomuraea sp.]NUP67375.1 SnoaL-like domain-containing protein [Nonomuraea sp.]NUP79378.1 SnoaL-like domain-containing protein [Nonomuraea sp.]NUS04708.1 SnoaL-like domain-containing protein [Nonomuraea sp.]
MDEHPHITVASNTYDAIAKGDLEELSRLLADDVIFHVPGRGPMARDYSGKEAVLGYLAELSTSTTGTLRLEPESYLVGADQVAAVLRIRGERDGRSLNDRGMQLFRIADGKISERWSFPLDPYSVDEFFA